MIRAGIILTIIAGLIGYRVYGEFFTQRDVTFTVKRLDDQPASGGHQYLVFTTRGDVYKNTDAWFHGKHDSSNIQGWLTVGDTYRCPVYGFRSLIGSGYPDLLDGCTQVTVKAAA